MLHWFINEQVEEEKNANEIVERLKFFGDNPAALFEIDQELKTRVAAPAGAESVAA
jgi:ferritin